MGLITQIYKLLGMPIPITFSIDAICRPYPNLYSLFTVRYSVVNNSTTPLKIYRSSYALNEKVPIFRLLGFNANVIDTDEHECGPNLSLNWDSTIKTNKDLGLIKPAGSLRMNISVMGKIYTNQGVFNSEVIIEEFVFPETFTLPSPPMI